MLKSPVLWGCVAAVALSAIQSLGITLQRKSHIIPYDHELSERSVVNLRRNNVVSTDHESSRNTHTYRRNLWLVGFSLFLFANLFGSLVQLTALPLIILSPLQSIGLIFNSVFSCTLLPGERFTKKLAGGTAIIAIGAFVIAFNGASTSKPPLDIIADEKFRRVVKKFLHPGFLTWWGCTFVFMAILVRINWLLSAKIRILQSKTQRRSRTIKDPLSRIVFIRGVIYGLVSGTLTAHTFLFAKSIVDVIFESVMERSTPKSASTYIIAIVLLTTTLLIVVMQLAAFNLGLSNILTAILYPLCFLVYNLVNLINDITFNRLLSTGGMRFQQLVYVLLGLSGVLYGVILISWDSAFGKIETEDSRPLLTAKFPYEHKAGEIMVLSYEESEIVSQFSRADTESNLEEVTGL